jgi:hypothetical protein
MEGKEMSNPPVADKFATGEQVSNAQIRISRGFSIPKVGHKKS